VTERLGCAGDGVVRREDSKVLITGEQKGRGCSNGLKHGLVTCRNLIMALPPSLAPKSIERDWSGDVGGPGTGEAGAVLGDMGNGLGVGPAFCALVFGGENGKCKSQ
jgi:hypothetical protein